jgi:hypothetical protein
MRRRICLLLDRSDHGELIVKDDAELRRNDVGAQVQNLGHFTGMLQAQSHFDAMTRMGDASAAVYFLVALLCLIHRPCSTIDGYLVDNDEA